MTEITTHKPSPAVLQLHQEVKESIHKANQAGAHMGEILALLSQVVGTLMVAVGTNSKFSPEEIMDVVECNIAEGNRSFMETLASGGFRVN